MLPCPRTCFHERIRCRLDSAPTKQFAALHLIKLQGLIVHGTQSSALINGQVLLVGEAIGNVRLVAVDSQHATVVLDGQTNVLSLSK